MFRNPFRSNNNQNNSGRSSNSSKQRNGNRNYNPYADRGRQGKYDNHQHNHAHNHQYQAQKETYVNAQSQTVAEAQTFMEQVDDMISTVSIAGESFQKGQDHAIVNALCDGAVVSLNMFAVSCEQLHQENNKDTLDLGRKRVYDKLAELALKNTKVYELIEPHRNFINAALNGQKNLRYKEDRVTPGAKALFERDPTEITGAFAKMIRHQQKFHESRDALLEPKTNQRLAKQHQSELDEYRRNDNKYGNRSKNTRNKSGSKKARPKVNNLYFTKSGKESKFVDTRAVQRAKMEEKAMDEDVFGSEDVYDDILPRQYMNAVLKLSKKVKWNGRSSPLPCLILAPNKHQRERQDKTMVKIMPCYPCNDVTLDATLDMIELDEDKIIAVENRYIARLKKCAKGVSNKAPLGYKSIEEQKEEARNIDFHAMCDDFGDIDIDGNNSDSNI